MPKSTYLSNKLLDLVYGAQPWTPPVTLYAALFTVSPSPGGGGTEFTGGGYARVACTNGLTKFPAASGGAKVLGQEISFPVLTADQGNAVALGFYDDPTAGNLISYGTISPAKSCLAGDRPYFPASTGIDFSEA